ncbi:MAG TPA: FAD binding domain-containing protein, partial [Usitatibacter sp.]|nr:FAD binding domain-containing protein [Usitatibacter sp.]
MKRFESTSISRSGELDPAASTVTQAMLGPQDRATIVKAGGIDVLGLMKQGLLAPRRVASLRIAGLDAIREEADGSLRIGSMATLGTIATHPLVASRYRALAQAALGAASPQIRRVATIGGNLLQRPRCWYFRSAHHACTRKGGTHCYAFAGENDYHAIFRHEGCAIVHPSTPATALVALRAHLELEGAKGARRTVALEDFLLGPDRDLHRENDLRPGEILTAVRLARTGEGSSSIHLRQGELDSFDWPVADVAAVLEMKDGICRSASIVLGAAAPVPYRARSAERA